MQLHNLTYLTLSNLNFRRFVMAEEKQTSRNMLSEYCQKWSNRIGISLEYFHLSEILNTTIIKLPLSVNNFLAFFLTSDSVIANSSIILSKFNDSATLLSIESKFKLGSLSCHTENLKYDLKSLSLQKGLSADAALTRMLKNIYKWCIPLK